MGARGPKSLPANVHLLRGNASKLPLPMLLDEFKPEVEIPSCPSWLWTEAKKEWKRITPELERYGLISKIDRSALTLYCQAWAEYHWAKTTLARKMEEARKAEAEAIEKGEKYAGGDGFVMPTASGSWTYSPYWVAANKASEQVDKYLQSFGLSPSSRGRVHQSDNRQSALPFDGDGKEGGGWNSL